jgi:hypothetical protein
MSSVQPVTLSDVLLGYRIGITISRFLPQQGTVNKPTPCPKKAATPIPLHEAFVLKSQDLEVDLNALSIQTTNANPMSLKCLPVLDKHRLVPGDILTTLRFIVFWVAYLQPLPQPLPLYAYNNLAVLKPNQDLILPQYLTLCLRSHSAQAQIRRLATQITKDGKKLGYNFSAISLAQLVSISIPLPSLPEQQCLVDEFHLIVANHLAFEQIILQRHCALQHRLMLPDQQDVPSDSLGGAQVGNYNLYRNRLNRVDPQPL